MYYWSTTFCSGRKIHTTHVFPVLPEGISNEMARQRVSEDPKKFLFYASFPPDYKRRGRRRQGEIESSFNFCIFLQPSLVINGSDPLSHLMGNPWPPALRSLGRSHQRGHWWRSIILRHFLQLDCFMQWFFPCQYLDLDPLRPFDIDCLKKSRIDA